MELPSLAFLLARSHNRCVAIYTPPHFSVEDLDIAHQVMRDHPFATLVSFADGEPWISHAPISLINGILVGHLARANPHTKFFDDDHPLTCIFHGPHAYVSPRWYDTPNQVPTWNYVVVHAQGRPQVLGDEETVRALLDLVAGYDPELTFEPEPLARQAKGVVAFRMEIDRLDCKFKMSQNKTEADRQGVIAGLLERDGPDDQAVATWVDSSYR